MKGSVLKYLKTVSRIPSLNIVKVEVLDHEYLCHHNSIIHANMMWENLDPHDAPRILARFQNDPHSADSIALILVAGAAHAFLKSS
jgi:hypothetical protein